MKKLYTSKTFLKMAGGRMDTPDPPPLDPWMDASYPRMYSSYPAPGHKLQKPSKESGLLQSLGTINFFLFYEKA